MTDFNHLGSFAERLGSSHDNMLRLMGLVDLCDGEHDGNEIVVKVKELLKDPATAMGTLILAAVFVKQIGHLMDNLSGEEPGTFLDFISERNKERQS